MRKAKHEVGKVKLVRAYECSICGDVFTDPDRQYLWCHDVKGCPAMAMLAVRENWTDKTMKAIG